MSGQNTEIVKLQIRRGPESKLPTLDAGEPAITTDTNKIFVGDGTTNHELAHKADLDATNVQLAQRANNTVYALSYVVGDGINDDTTNLQNAINATPSGGVLILNCKCLVSGQISITKPMTILGNWNRNKSTHTLYGSQLIVTSSTVQSSLQSVILINSFDVKILGIGLKGAGSSYGSIGVLCLTSNGSKLDMHIEGFGQGLNLGSNSAHVSMHKSHITGCNDAIVFDNGNLFDFYFEDTQLEGNVRSSAFLVANTSVENVTFQRCHMGFQQYGILQDASTTTGDGFSALHLIDTPIEQVSVQHINIINGGNIRVEGGYWTWTSTPQAVSALVVKNLSTGGIWFAPKLESTYPNASSPSLVSITGYTNFNIYLFGALNNFASKWANWGADNSPLPIRRVFYENNSFGGQGTRIDKVTITPANNNQIITTQTPLVNGAYEIKVWIRVINTCTVTVGVAYNNGNGSITKNLANALSLTPDDYFYSWFCHAETYNAINVFINASVDSSIVASASIIPR